MNSLSPNILALTLAVVLGGCTLMPTYERPVAPVPATYPTGNAADAAASPAAADIGWRDFFADERLRRIIALALANNRDLRVAVLNIEKSRAQYRIQESEL